MNDEDLIKIGYLLDEKLSASEKRISAEIGDFIESNLLPQLEEKADKSDIDRIERKLDRSLAKDLEQDHRLGKMESLPVIAHQLKSKKRTTS